MIHIFCASTGRGGQSERIIDNVLNTSPGLICMVLSNDNVLYNLHARFAYYSRLNLFFEPYSPSFSYGINAGWGRIRYRDPSKNILACAVADDMEFLDGWYKAALNCYNDKFPEKDGLLFLNDITTDVVRTPQNVGRTGACVVSAKFCDLYMGGWLVSPYYHCNGLDVEYAGVAEKHGKRAYCPEAQVKHLMFGWEIAKDSEQRKIGIATNKARAKRGWLYDIEAPWRYWK